MPARRHFGVTAKQAKDERLGTALGRLAFRELISETQYQAVSPSADSTATTTPRWACRRRARAPWQAC